MYAVAGEKRPIFSESDAFLYNLGDPTVGDFTNKYVNYSDPTFSKVMHPLPTTTTFIV